MLLTQLDHLETKTALKDAIENNDNVMICCGRMGPMCVPVYGIMEAVRTKFPHVKFFDQDFDGPASDYIRNLPECAGFSGLPFTVYFKKGKPVAATTSIQTLAQIETILAREFGEA